MWRCPRRVSTVVCVHEPRCQPPNCSGHGTCVDGHCECTGHFWRGDACSELDCGPSNCNQHGLCTESEWGAHRRVVSWWDPSSPTLRFLPLSSPGLRGLALAAGCRCDAGWTGSNCSEGESCQWPANAPGGHGPAACSCYDAVIPPSGLEVTFRASRFSCEPPYVFPTEKFPLRRGPDFQ